MPPKVKPIVGGVNRTMVIRNAKWTRLLWAEVKRIFGEFVVAKMAKDTLIPATQITSRRTSRLVKKGLALGLIFLVVLEITLRVTLGLGTPVLIKSDPDCGYIQAPNQRVRRLFCLNEINAEGMRSPKIKNPKPAGEFRVLFVGDSVTYGTTYVDQSHIFTSILQNDLPEQLHRPVEVLNASAGGWAVGNELGFIRARGIYEADLVVFVLNTGDMVQPFSADCAGKGPGMPDHNPPLALVELWQRYLWPRLSNTVAHDPGSSIAKSSVADDLAACRETCRSLDAARKIALANNAKFAIVYSPMNESPNPNTASWVAILTDWAATSKIPILDLTAAYSAAPRADVYQDQIHLRARGDELAAQAIEQWATLRSFDRTALAK